MAVDVGPSSRLLFAELLEIDGIEFWDTLVLPDNKPRQTDITYTVESGDRIDLLAARFYQDVVLWWVIAWANDFEIIPTDLKQGQAIQIPSKEFVEGQLLRRVRTTG